MYARTLRQVKDSMDLPSMFSGDLSPEELMNRWHFAALFSNKVFYACRRTGVTPTTATGKEFSVNALLAEAESELGLDISESRLSMMSKWERHEAEFLVKERRQFAYSTFLRLTSGALSPQSKAPMGDSGAE
jgi:hypothetical protein